jgi:hypothetical protein
MLVTRGYCHLCDEMVHDLLPYRQAMGELLVVDADASQELEARFGDFVPVLLKDGIEVCHYVLDHAAVKARLGSPPSAA